MSSTGRSCLSREATVRSDPPGRSHAHAVSYGAVPNAETAPLTSHGENRFMFLIKRTGRLDWLFDSPPAICSVGGRRLWIAQERVAPKTSDHLKARRVGV
jgi:hypothetical protein